MVSGSFDGRRRPQLPDNVHPMLVRYFVEVPFSFETVEQGILRAPQEWIPGLARVAEKRGTELLAEVGFGNDGRRLRKEVEIELGEPMRIASKTLLPMTWRATNAQGLFPVLEGDLEVAALGAERTQLAVSARYRPPLGRVGKVIDRALLHRVAEATVKDFLDRIGHQIEELFAAVE
jgi:hypothetical protein